MCAEGQQTLVSVVAPIYNERENVEPLCRAIHEALSSTSWLYEIILVDDGSTDGSWEAMVEMTREIPHLRLIRLRRNFGQTAAMSAGFDHAQGTYVVTLDADLQNDPRDIPRLVEHAMKGFDVVSGWRKDRKDPFLTRRVPSMAANWLISNITGVHLHDHGCTLKVYHRDVLKNVRLYGEMHRFIPALASWVGCRIDEVVVAHHPRQFGRSKYGLSRTVRVILDLITVKFLLHYSMGPIQMFGKIGAMFFTPGLLMFALMIGGNVLYRLTGHPNPADDLVKRPFWIMSAFMFIFFGTQFVSMGLLAEMQIRTYHESQNKPIYVIKETVCSR
jgi:glycosyltransferase involved in cell wall biosynthesis